MTTEAERRALRSTTTLSLRASRHAKPSASYREPSSESNEEPKIIDTTSESEAQESRSSVKKRTARREAETPVSKRYRRTSPPSSLTDSQRIRPKPHKKQQKYNNSDPNSNVTVSPLKQTQHRDEYSTGNIPHWTSLPYQILIQVFHYSSHPLYDERTFQPSPSVNWLVRVARICRPFAEPALTVLYRSPPLVPMERAHRLRQLLVADLEAMSYNYRAKIERIQMEISQTAAYTLPGSGLLDLHGIIFNCPRLLDLELYHQMDMSPYRSLDEPIKWSYPDSLFDALEENVSGLPTHLRSWRWSSRLAGKTMSIQKIVKVHQSPSFSGLRKLAFVNYQKPFVRKNAEDPQHEKMLADSLSALPLEHLIIESSTLANAILLPLLPQNLKHLELINCWEIVSEDLAAFLITHGGQLHSLTLNHNQSLSLSFLTVLGSACPHLETLKMNLTYYNAHSTYRDSQPLYAKLIEIDEVPDWPLSLQTIELTQLRNWDIDIAKMFFQSLLGSAANLVNLRRLVIKAILNTSWRDRSSFRDKWVGAFQRVFKRPITPPNPHLCSTGAYMEYKKRHGRSDSKSAGSDNVNVVIYQPETPQLAKSLGIKDESGSRGSDGSPKKSETRRSNRVVPPKSDQSQENKNPKDENHRSETTRITLRERKRTQAVSRELAILQKTAGSDSLSRQNHAPRSEIDSDNEPLARRTQQQPGQSGEFIQGMCDVLSITIDNLRPTETQFVEADFLDSEPEGDEDWDENQDLPEEGSYAW